MINEHAFPWTMHLEWNMFSFCSFLAPSWPPKTLLKTTISPSSASFSTSSWFSSWSSTTSSSFSSLISVSFTASYSAKVIAFLFGQSAAMCPSPWHLKHFLVFKGLGLGVFYGGRLFCGAGVLYGVERVGVVGLRKEMGFPLSKSWFWGRHFENSCLKGLDCLCCLTL